MKSNIVPEKDWQRIERFVRVFLDHQGSNPTVDAPADMVAGPPDTSGWIPWQPVDSPVTDQDIARLEKQAGTPFPPLFRAYLMYKCLLMTQFNPVVLPETPSNAPLQKLKRLLKLIRDDPFFKQNGYIPFGQDANGAGPVCFDTKHPSVDQDYPVVVVDHDRMGNPGYTGERRWDSFASLLDVMEADMLSFDDKR
jgi:hypothetical protein